MGEKLEALWLVTHPESGGCGGHRRAPLRKLFRTRAAARQYMDDKRSRMRNRDVPFGPDYELSRVTWGPEQ